MTMASAPDNLPAVQPPAMSPQRERYQMLKDQARLFALSPLIPEHLRKGGADAAAANCMIAIQMAERMGEMPLVVLQNIHIVNGKAGFASQYMIARANSSGVFAGRINWRIRGKGDDLEVEAFAFLKETGEEVSFIASMRMAKAEGWTSNKKYQSMPEVMLRYRSAAFLIRFYAPDVMLGHQTIDEIVDVVAASEAAPPVTAAALLAQASEGDDETVEAEQADEDETGKPDEDRGEAHEGAADAIIIEIDLRTTVPDINSYVSSQKDTIAALSEEDRGRIAEAQTARIDAIKAGKA
jgi:hypothetical protein